MTAFDTSFGEASKKLATQWGNTTILSRLPNYELVEYICNENNRDLPHLVGR